MNLLFLNTYCGYLGGVEQNIANAAKGLRKRGHQCTLIYQKETDTRADDYQQLFDHVVLAPTGKELTAVLKDLIQKKSRDALYVHKIDSVKPLLPLKDSIRMVRMIHDHDECCPRRHKYYVFPNRICNHPAGLRCWADLAFLERDPQARLGLHFKNLTAHKKELIRNRDLFDAYLIGSRFMQEELIMNGFDPEKINCLPPCVELSDRKPSPVPDSHEILYVGQLIKGKGVDLLLHSLTYISEPFHLTIAGSGNARESLKELTKKLDLDESVDFAGWVSPKELDILYDRCRVLAVPSRWAEPFGMIGLEAMQRGRPVVAFDVGGIPDWLESGITGYTVPEEDVEKFADALNRLLADHHTAQLFGEHGRKKIEAAFSFENYLDHLSQTLKGDNQ